MCGRYRLSRRKQLVEEYFDCTSDERDWEPHYNIAPTQSVAVIRQNPEKPVRELSLMRWGLIPSWAKDESGAASMINAGSEAASTKPAFADALKYRRCLIPADGFYEWKRSGNLKQPFCFEVNSGELFAFAGLWDPWRGTNGACLMSCSILTTTPNAITSAVHDRMPVILHVNCYDLWLDPGMRNVNKVRALLALNQGCMACMSRAMLKSRPLLIMKLTTFLIAFLVVCPALGQKQTETDEYTRYDLLAPESSSFAIHYEVTATTPGATEYFNPIRKSSVASNESVFDVMTGQPLHFEVVSGEEAGKDPLMKGEDTSVDYIKIRLARPVPPEGQARLLILKTYKDSKSYYREGDMIIFNRQLSIPRNSVVLPAGFELVACNVPSQVLSESDGRIAISFLNSSGAEAPLIMKAKLGAQTGPPAAPSRAGEGKSWEAPFAGETEQERLSERAHQDREIVYFLQQPQTHAFRLYHDYTESRVGVDK